MKPWNKLSLIEKTKYCSINKLTLLTAEVRYTNLYKLQTSASAVI
jgi:hypothetical protein